MNHQSTDEIKVKEEPLESEQQHEKMDLLSSNIKPESLKLKDNKTVHCKPPKQISLFFNSIFFF